MTDAIFTHDAGVSAFEDASGVVQTADDGDVTFSWDEDHIVTVDAPANLAGAFDTDRFYKIEGATIARPIKQPYMVGDDIEWYKKPAEELDTAAWSFDNAPFTLGHPETGMVKNVDDIHGFWRNPRYDHDKERLKEDLYVPVEDDEALEFIEENSDVSVGFYNRVHSNYAGNTGDLTDDDDVDGFQVDMFGNHIAGVERGRCSSEHGCGLDGSDHGEVVTVADGTPTQESLSDDSGGLDDDSTQQSSDANCGCGPNEDNSTMRDDDPTNDDDGTDGGFDIPDLSVDAIAEKNDAVQELKEQADKADSLREDLDEMRSEITEAFDAAEHFSVDLEDDECPCEAVDELVSDLDAKVEEVEDLRSELTEYRQDDIEDRLDTLAELGADRDEWEETADEADDPLEALDDEIERRKEVLESADADVSVKDIDSSTDSTNEDTDDTDRTINGTRRFGRGHGA